MPDTSEAAFRGHAERWHLEGDIFDRSCSGVEPVENTWFETIDSVVDTPLVLLIPRDDGEGANR